MFAESGLAVEPTPDSNPDILATIRSQAETGGTDETTVRVTLYRMGFQVDDGPHRRLDDPANADFLRSLSQGRTPQELMQGGNVDIAVQLVDRRQVSYEEYMASEGRGGAGATTSFTGEGQSLGGTTEAVVAGGVISPSNRTDPPEVDGSKPSTTLLVRLLNGKRLKVKVNSESPVSVVAQHVNASGDAGSEEYVLSSGFPPRVIEDLTISVKEAGLEGAQVMQKKV